MTTKFIRATLAAALLVAAAPAAIIAASPAFAQEQKISRSVGEPLIAAQKAAVAKDWATAKTNIAKARAVSSKTPFDDYKINEMSRFISVNSGDMAAAVNDAIGAADSPIIPEADKMQAYRAALVLTYNAQNYPKAVEYSKKLELLNPTDVGVLDTMGQAYYFGNDIPAAQALSKKRIAAAKAAGRRPDHASLELLLNTQVKLNDQDGAQTTLEDLVVNYNNPNDWQNMIEIGMGTKGIRDEEIVWLGRLLLLSGAPVNAQDATIIGQTASHLTFFGDAQNAQAKGGTGFPDANPRATADKKTIAAQITAGEKANGQYNAKLAEALYGYGMYPEAEKAAQLALTKGGATDSSEAPMVLAQAQAAQGKYDDALASFGKVTGGGPATARTVRLWVAYVNTKKNPPVAAAAAAPAPAPAR